VILHLAIVQKVLTSHGTKAHNGMCGIAGIASLSQTPIHPDAIKSMCDTIAHRGPDDAGYAYFRTGLRNGCDGGSWAAFADEEFRHSNEHLPVYGGAYYKDVVSNTQFCVVLGHRRLSIIDLTHYGHQPMASSDGRLWITYNGEIYNFQELRQLLKAAGYHFRSGSDTEVLLHLWHRYGVDALPMLDGMFAFAIYDRVDNRLTLARDRFGVKPLYYAVVRGHLVFASETKAILASGLLRGEIEPAQLVEYLAFQNLYGSHTLFRHIRVLRPGEYLTLSPGEDKIPERRVYHNAFPQVDAGLSDPRAAAKSVSTAFAGAVSRQLVSDVEVGSYLSGGMDSGSIVAVAGRSISRLLTFTCGFDLTNVNGLEQGFDERGAAERLAYLLQTEHYDVVLHAGDMPAVMEKLTWHLDDPRVGMCHQNWYVAKLASRFVKVCLAGAGGDELFAGYPWRYLHGLKARSFAEFDEAYFRYWQRLVSLEELPKLCAPDFRGHAHVPREQFDQVMAAAPHWQDELSCADNMLQRALYFELKTFLHGFLIVEDRISMAHGLETRVPFLDNSLADLACRLPPSLKLDTTMLSQRDPVEPFATTDGKRVLRQAMEAFLPAEFTRQKKQGFSPPDENWFRGSSMDYIRDVLLDRRTRQRPWFNQRYVQERLEEHFQGRRNHRLLIWSLLSLELLQRHHTDCAADLPLEMSA
jgi:asparagine synthase (glutamine-hydrolysing)